MMWLALRARWARHWRTEFMAKSGQVKLWTLWALAALAAALILLELFQHRPWHIAMLGVTLIHLTIVSVFYWRQSRQSEERPMISLVLLLAQPRYLGERALGKLVGKGGGVAMDDSKDAL